MTFKLSNLLLQTAPLWILGSQAVAVAQVSLPSDPSSLETTNIQPATSDTSVVQEGNQITILGGQSSAGSELNLLHQFQRFDLGTDNTANFIVNPDIANVISLINSTDASIIDGFLQITSSDPHLTSSANLFLVNPAGIIFGQNVTLNLPANLTATTSSGLLFQDKYLLAIDGSVSEIDISTSDAVSLASVSTVTSTINHLIGEPNGYLLLAEAADSMDSDPLSLTLPPGTIENRGKLEVAPQSSITLIGQYVQNDGTLVASAGNISLVAASGENLLRLSQPDSLLSLDVIPVETASALTPVTGKSTVSALASTDLALLLTGGNEQSATRIEINADGTQSLMSGAPSLTPASGSVLVRGTLDVSDNALPGQFPNSPGQVTILGDQINLVSGEVYADAIGQAGTISIGGMPVADSLSATHVIADRTSKLSASSLENKGGVIEIWADDSVSFYGDAIATGSASDLAGTISIDAGNTVDIR